MKLPSVNCGLPIKITSTVTIVSEILACGVSVVLCAHVWLNQKESAIFVYNGSGDYKSRNKELRACVIYWILTLIGSLAIARVVASLILAVAIKKNSTLLSLSWIMFKVLALFLSLIFSIASLTVSSDYNVCIAAWFDFVTQLVTSYFVCILIPQIEVMAKSYVIQTHETTKA